MQAHTMLAVTSIDNSDRSQLRKYSERLERLQGPIYTKQPAAVCTWPRMSRCYRRRYYPPSGSRKPSSVWLPGINMGPVGSDRTIGRMMQSSKDEVISITVTPNNDIFWGLLMHWTVAGDCKTRSFYHISFAIFGYPVRRSSCAIH